MIIHLISSPRNISTALMYSFAQRPEMKVIDEPFYGYYLSVTKANHPGREEIIESMPKNPDEIFSVIKKLEKQNEHVFIKNMAHHILPLIENNVGFQVMIPLFLIRNPSQIIASFSEVISSPTLADIGCKRQLELFQKWSHLKPIVIDSSDIIENPKGLLKAICEQLGIAFDLKMLSWESKPRKEDGIWAKYWYKNIHSSTGFMPQSTSNRPLPKKLIPLYEEARPYFNELATHKIKIN